MANHEYCSTAGVNSNANSEQMASFQRFCDYCSLLTSIRTLIEQ